MISGHGNPAAPTACGVGPRWLRYLLAGDGMAADEAPGTKMSRGTAVCNKGTKGSDTKHNMHYNNVIWRQKASATRLFVHQRVQASIKRHQRSTLQALYTSHPWIPLTKGQWFRKRVLLTVSSWDENSLGKEQYITSMSSMYIFATSDLITSVTSDLFSGVVLIEYRRWHLWCHVWVTEQCVPQLFN